MWKKITILIFSVALNTGFVGMWAVRVLPTHFRRATLKPELSAKSCVSCPLHRKLGTSEKQWREIEPRLIEFKTASGAICREINQLRMELIDLMAAPQTDSEAIRARQEGILACQRTMQELLISHILAEKQMLTPEQQKSLFEMLRQRDDCAGSSAIVGVRPCAIPQADLNHAANNNHDERR